jgi:mycofactocin precursor
MDDTTTLETQVEEPSAATADEPTDVDVVDEELLIEEVSIDGMCGVY